MELVDAAAAGAPAQDRRAGTALPRGGPRPRQCPPDDHADGLSGPHARASRGVGRASEASENPPFAGEPAALVDHLQELADSGFDLFQMVFAGFPDTSDMRLFVDEVLPKFDTGQGLSPRPGGAWRRPARPGAADRRDRTASG